MVGLCFYFEDNDVDVYSGRSIDLDAWNYASKAAGDVNKWAIINRTDQAILGNGTYSLSLYSTYSQFLAHTEGLLTYIIPQWSATDDSMSLWDWRHSTDWYVFGPADGWDELKTGIYIPQSGRVALHSVHAASCVLFHRYKVRNGITS